MASKKSWEANDFRFRDEWTLWGIRWNEGVRLNSQGLNANGSGKWKPVSLSSKITAGEKND